MYDIPYFTGLEGVVAVIAAYLWGAIPSSYLAARRLRGLDIRRFGSGNVGASNAAEALGVGPAVAIGAFDCLGKGVLPIVLAKAVGLDAWVQGLVGVAAIAGHNWSPYIRMTGGRGVSVAIGALLGLLMWREVLIVGVLFGLIGRLILKDTALWTLVALLTLPPLTYVFTEPAALSYTAIAIALVIVAKRVTGNWEGLSSGERWYRVVANRIVWDRDISSRESWISRREP